MRRSKVCAHYPLRSIFELGRLDLNDFVSLGICVKKDALKRSMIPSQSLDDTHENADQQCT